MVCCRTRESVINKVCVSQVREKKRRLTVGPFRPVCRKIQWKFIIVTLKVQFFYILYSSLENRECIKCQIKVVRETELRVSNRTSYLLRKKDKKVSKWGGKRVIKTKLWPLSLTHFLVFEKLNRSYWALKENGRWRLPKVYKWEKRTPRKKSKISLYKLFSEV